MTTTRDLALRYFHACMRGAFSEATRLLADDFTYEGPSVSLFPLDLVYAPGYWEADLHACVCEGSEAALLYTCRSQTPRRAVQVADHLTIAGDTIRRIVQVYDEAAMQAYLAHQPWREEQVTVGTLTIDLLTGPTHVEFLGASDEHGAEVALTLEAVDQLLFAEPLEPAPLRRADPRRADDRRADDQRTGGRRRHTG